MDWNKLATPTEITFEHVSDAIDYACMNGKNEGPALTRLMVKFQRGKEGGRWGIDPARYPEFLTELAKL
jgi:hypothetical protein